MGCQQTRLLLLLIHLNPKNVAELQFLGGALTIAMNLYHQWHPDKLKKGVPWKWNKDCQDAFDQAKQALMSADLLAHYDPHKKEIILTVDA